MTFSPFKCQFLNSQLSKTEDIEEPSVRALLHVLYTQRGLLGCNFQTCPSSASKHLTCDPGKMHPSCQSHQARCVRTGQSKMGPDGVCTVQWDSGQGCGDPLGGAVGLAQPPTSSRTSLAL